MAKTINAKKETPPQETLNALLKYESQTGRLYWKERPETMFTETSKHSQGHVRRYWNSRYAGKEAFTWHISGYRFGTLFKEKFAAHRVIWKMIHGVDAQEIDHINGDRADNRIENLRDVSRAENRRNIRMLSNNTSGHMGVIKCSSSGRWHARIKVKGRSIHLGSYSYLEEAVLRRKQAEAEYGFHVNHGRPAQA